MRLVKAIALLACALFATIPAAADTPYLGFDLLNAQGVNQYFTGFYVNQTLGSVFIVSGSSPLLVTHLGVFDMNPDNEPNWDPTNPPNSAYGFNTQHATALFKRFRSRVKDSFSDKLLSAMRKQFGGHVEPKAGAAGGKR